MHSIAHLKPQLIDCHISHEENVIFLRAKNSLKTIILPKESEFYLKMFNGLVEIEEIISLSFDKDPHFSLRTFMLVLTRINQESFLKEKIDEKLISTSDKKTVFSKNKSIFLKEFFKKNLSTSISIGKNHFKSFNLLLLSTFAILILFGSMEGFNFEYPEGYRFLKNNNNGYLYSFLFFFFFSSVVLNFKFFIKVILELFLNGKVQNPMIKLYFFGITLELPETAISEKNSNTIKNIYLLLSPFIFLSLLTLVKLINTNTYLSADMTIIILLLSFINLNPFRQSEFTESLERIFSSDRLRHFIPYLKGRALVALFRKKSVLKDDRYLIFFASLSYLWLICFTSFEIRFFSNDFPSLFSAIYKGTGLIEKLSALGLLSIFTFMFLEVINDYLEIVITHFKLQTESLIPKVIRSFGVKKLSNKNLLSPEMLRSFQFFSTFSENGLREIIKTSSVSALKKNKSLFRKGDPANSLYILISGKLEVYDVQESGLHICLTELNHGTIFGESALIESSNSRKANVKAIENSIILEIPAMNFKNILSNEVNYQEISDRIMVNQYFGSSPLFSKVSAESLPSLISKGTLISCTQGKTITEQGSHERDFYMILRGQVKVEIDKKEIAKIDQGGFFGEMSMLKKVPRSATITTVDKCTFFKLSHKSFLEVIAKNPEIGAEIEKISNKRKDENKWLI